MRKIAQILADNDAGRPLTKSETDFMNAYFKSEIDKTNNNIKIEPNTLSKGLDVLVGMASITVDKLRDTGKAAIKIGEEHRQKTTSENIKACRANMDVIEGQYRRNEISKEEHDEQMALRQEELDKLMS